jgi:diguanylate cyclase (GGDEF)-like protein
LEEDIITDLTVLQDRLDKMIIRVEQRDFALQQFQVLQTTLFTLNSLPEMIDSVIAQSKVFFELTTISLALLNAEGKISSYLNDYGYKYQQNHNLVLLSDTANNLSNQAFIGGYDHAKHSVFFPHAKQKPGGIIIIPLSRHGEYLGSLNLACDKADNLPSKMKLEFVTQLGFAVSICLENHLNFAIAQQAYRNEALVNANNRRFLEQRLVEELERRQRSTHALSCIMLDVTFPAQKDPHQTAQLDIQVLPVVSETIKRQLRVGDVFSYYEGKKFAAFLPDAPESVIISIIERLKTALTEQVINFANQIIPLSVSFGYASYLADNTASTQTQSHQQIALNLIATADTNLYNAKHKPTPQNKKITAA